MVASPLMNEDITKIRVAVQWIALLLVVLTVMVGLAVFGVVDLSVVAGD